MTEEVKDAKKGYEESSGHSNGPMVVPEDPEKAFARTTKYERRVKFFAHIILAIGIIYAAYNLYNNYETASRGMEVIDKTSYLMSTEQIGAAKGGIIGAVIGTLVGNLLPYVAIWIALTLAANASIRSKENEMKIDNM